MTNEAAVYPSGRVAKYDSAEIDDAIRNILYSGVDSVVNGYDFDVLQNRRDVVKFLLDSFLLVRTLVLSDRTLGQRMMDLRYVDTGTNQHVRKQRLALIAAAQCSSTHFFTLGMPLVTRLLPQPQVPFIPQSWAVPSFERIAVIVKETLFLANFAAFLMRGKYPTSIERVFRVDQFHSRPPDLASIDFSVTNREILWRGFSDILMFVLPLINVRRIRNTVKRFLSRSRSQTDSDDCKRASLITHDSLKVCVHCQEFPILPQQYGCRHIMCYFCLFGNLKADPTLRCPECDLLVDVINVSPVTL